MHLDKKNIAVLRFLEKEIFVKKNDLCAKIERLSKLRIEIAVLRQNAEILKNTYLDLQSSQKSCSSTTTMVESTAWHHKALKLCLACEKSMRIMQDNIVSQSDECEYAQAKVKELEEKHARLTHTSKSLFVHVNDLLIEIDNNAKIKDSHGGY